MPDPRSVVTPSEDAPVVAVLDTGLGRHPWFPPEDEDARAEDCTHPCPGAHRRATVACSVKSIGQINVIGLATRRFGLIVVAQVRFMIMEAIRFPFDNETSDQ